MWVYQVQGIRFTVEETRLKNGCEYFFYVSDKQVAQGYMIVFDTIMGRYLNYRSPNMPTLMTKLADKIDSVYVLIVQDRRVS